jgi:hypothetical protein
VNEHSQGSDTAPYSPLMCILLLLATGAAVMIGAAI